MIIRIQSFGAVKSIKTQCKKSELSREKILLYKKIIAVV